MPSWCGQGQLDFMSETNGSSGSPNYIRFHMPELSQVQRHYCVRFEVLVLWNLMVSSLIDRGACISEDCVLMLRVNDLKCLAWRLRQNFLLNVDATRCQIAGGSSLLVIFILWNVYSLLLQWVNWICSDEFLSFMLL